jgi:mRNA-degrading endonuclease RelE of RelBE toxin-antitoxin system
VGAYRILYVIDDGIRIVELREVGHRKDIYR